MKAVRKVASGLSTAGSGAEGLWGLCAPARLPLPSFALGSPWAVPQRRPGAAQRVKSPPSNGHISPPAVNRLFLTNIEYTPSQKQPWGHESQRVRGKNSALTQCLWMRRLRSVALVPVPRRGSDGAGLEGLEERDTRILLAGGKRRDPLGGRAGRTPVCSTALPLACC